MSNRMEKAFRKYIQKTTNRPAERRNRRNLWEYLDG